jgi:hypothetical protein
MAHKEIGFWFMRIRIGSSSGILWTQ